MVGDEDLERCQELLLGTSWDGDLDEAKVARDALSGLLRVPVPVMKATSSAQGSRAGARGVRDENASYGALLSDFGRGL
jgi:hypothetical protein